MTSETSDQAPGARDARIASIIDAIGDGTYRVDDLEVADAVLKRWQSFDVLMPEPSEDQGAGQPASADAASSEASSR
ncbi:MAG: flagellar biosynthesis anti-sigma factor FlgM [Acidimicrobiia bacterium]